MGGGVKGKLDSSIVRHPAIGFGSLAYFIFLLRFLKTHCKIVILCLILKVRSQGSEKSYLPRELMES